MSLIKCIECNKEISDKSKECPYCVCPTSESLKIKDLEISNYDYKCKNCSGTEYTQIENQGGIFWVCDKCGYVDEIVPRQQSQQQNIPKCPTCQSINIKRISATSKVMGAIGFGLLSKTAKSQFECKSCGYKW